MSKKLNINPADLESTIMAKVNSSEILMKPRWYFVLGSILMTLGVASLSVVAVFLTNLTLFSLRRHGPMGEWRLQVILNSFPFWVPALAIVGVVLGIVMLRKYDFSYKKNFWLVVAVFVVSIILAGFMLDYFGLNDIWSRKGPMRRFYQQTERPDVFPRGQVRRRI